MFAPLVSPDPQHTGRKTRDAARELRAKADASAAFPRAHAAEQTATRSHDQCVTEFWGGREQEVVLEGEKRELLVGRRAAMRLEEVEVAKLRAVRLAKEQAYRASLKVTEGKLALVIEANKKRAAAVHEAAEVKERACAESIGCRGLREDARGPAVRAADAAGSPVLPRPVWGRGGARRQPSR